MKRSIQSVQTATGRNKRSKVMPGDPRPRPNSTERPSERSTAVSSPPRWIVVDDGGSSESDSAPFARSPASLSPPPVVADDSSESDSAPPERSPAASSSPPWVVADDNDSSDTAPSESSSTSSDVAPQNDGNTRPAQARRGQDQESANIHLLKTLIELHVTRVLERNKGRLVQALMDQVIAGKTEQESAFLFTNIIRSRAKINIAFHQCYARVGK